MIISSWQILIPVSIFFMLFISNLLQLLKKPIKLEAFYDVAGLSVLNPPMFYQVSTIKYLICLQHEMGVEHQVYKISQPKASYICKVIPKI